MHLNTPALPSRDGVLDPRIDGLLLRLRGLVLVGELLEARGASPGEIDEHAREAGRVRAELARLIGDDLPGLAA
jgi:hypothetical protein